MSFFIEPNKHYLKILTIIQSCNSLNHFAAAEKCIDIYDSREKMYKDYYKKSDERPIVGHTGHYDHLAAVWILRKKLNHKKENLGT